MWSADKAGFTLLEIVAVMAIVAMVAALVVAAMPGTGRPTLKAVTLDAAALLRRERVGAIMTGRDRGVSLDRGNRVLVGDGGDVIAIPRDVALDVLGVDRTSAGRLAVVRFHPDGASSGAVMRLSHDGATYEIRVNWYTGGVSLGSP